MTITLYVIFTNFVLESPKRESYMPNIFHTFPINAPATRVFLSISTATGLDAWWSKKCTCDAMLNGIYRFDFGPDYQWAGVVSKYIPGQEFELTMTIADSDWTGSKVSFVLNERNGHTEVNFSHTGWPENNEHYRISNFCWAMYLRLLKRYSETGETVPYEIRLEA